jgi:hypothetical protein
MQFWRTSVDGWTAADSSLSATRHWDRTASMRRSLCS